MSMLAERRQKTRYIIQPGKRPIWKADEEGMKFGKQLMEKMGWSAGKGLGAKEQGISEPIRLNYKNDTKGMGFKENDDNWIQNQEDFNSLLSALKGDDSSENAEGMTEVVRESLEEKSKKSRARVHYQKFTRGKDLSKYSEEDLACILGSKRKRRKQDKEEEEPEKNDEEDKDGTENKSEESNEKENTFGVTTINGGSLADYFKRKWKHIQKPPENAPFIEDLEPAEETKQESKKRKKVHFEEEEEEGITAVDDSMPMDGGLEDTEMPTESADVDKSKKKKKKKKKDNEEESLEGKNRLEAETEMAEEEDKMPVNDVGSLETDTATEDLLKSTDVDKSKKKKKKKRKDDEFEKSEEESPGENSKLGAETEIADAADKRLEEVDAPMEDLSEKTEDEKNKKKKKKRKQKESGNELLEEKNKRLEIETAVADEASVNDSAITETNSTMEDISEPTEEDKSKKKKKKKRKENELENQECEGEWTGEKNKLEVIENVEPEVGNCEEAEEKKKRKKKKRESSDVSKEGEAVGNLENFLEEAVQETVPEISEESLDLEGEKKKRKKKKKEVAEELLEEKIENDADVPETEENSKKRKKKDKRKEKNLMKDEMDSNCPENSNELNSINPEENGNLVEMKDKLSKTNFSVLRYSEDKNKRKKTFEKSKILNLVCDLSLDKFKGSNLGAVPGYGIPKPKR